MKSNLKAIFVAVVFSGFVFGEAAFFGNILKLHTTDESLFPASSATITGGLLYGTDAGAIYINAGARWKPAHLAGTKPFVVRTSTSGTLNVPMAHFTASSFPPPSTISVKLDSAVTIIPGTGAGSQTYIVYNETTLATVASVTVSCAAAEGTIALGTTGAVANNDVLDVRTSANTCTTSPSVNLTVGVLYNP